MTKTLNRKLVLIATGFERYVLSLVYLGFAASHLRGFSDLLTGRIRPETTLFIDATHQLTMLLLCIFTSLLLLLARRAAVPPKQLQHILVPLAASFYNFLFYTIQFFPASWQVNLSPPGLHQALFAAGLACIILGPAFSFWGILHLGRSFGIFVTVRKPVTTGPYQWVRHPMYLGWICLFIGIALANFSGAYILLVAVNIALILYRARLEQTMLADDTAEYREYMKHTGFIFPRITNPFRRFPQTD